MSRLAFFSAVLAVLLQAVAAPAQARDALADVDVHISTLGWGLGLAVPVSDSVDARVGFNQFTRSYNTSTATANGTVNYTGNLKLASYDLLADWHPFHGITHLTAGFLYNDNKVQLTSTGQYTWNGTTYTSPLTSTVTFNKFAPYLGFGWSGQAKKTGFSFKSDFGILFQGSPSASVTSTDPAVQQSGALAGTQASLNDKLRNFRYYPVVSVGIGYAF